MDATATRPEISGRTTMRDVESLVPGARRALFSRYHIGGCQSCGFEPGESLASVCERNDKLPVEEVVSHLLASHENDLRMQISPQQLKALVEGAHPPRIVDIRTREEFESVRLPHARLMSQDLQQEAFGSWDKNETVVICDHKGPRALDTAAYFIGHGFNNAKALRGGIDAYSQEADPAVPRYQIEFDAPPA
jgi:rhodanese-related sulfurtransferase